MACFVTPTDRDALAYHGVGKIFEYTNGDGRLARTNCGLAAAATFLTFHGKFSAIEQREPPHPPLSPGGEGRVRGGHQVMRLIERDYPPDNLGGLFGTSRRRVEQICRAYGIRTRAIRGEAALRAHIQYGNPVIVMLGVSAQFFGFDLPIMGHWMVVYGFDAEHVYITNWYQRLTWEKFREGWDAFIPRLINMRRRALVALPATL